MVGQIRCLIIDDEPIARVGMRNYISKITSLELVGECPDVYEANRILGNQKIDLIFLDIELPYIKGIDYIRQMDTMPFVIITSAHSEYALDGFELNVTDYLLKPFSFKRFESAVLKVENLLVRTQRQQEDFILIRENRETIKLMANDLLYLQAMENFVMFITSERKHIVGITLQKAFDLVKQYRFVQVHKSFIVNLDRVDVASGTELKISDYIIPLSRNFKKDFDDRFKPSNNLLRRK
jgi:DNA-binding LytR/AlgR family response regulator